MALTRKMLKAMELDDDKISQIIDAHQSTIDEIATERDQYKTDSEKYKAEVDRLTPVEKELVKANAKLEDAKDVSNKYKTLQEEFDTYRNNVKAKATHDLKEKAYRALLAEAGISDKRFNSIIKVTDLSGIELDDDGNVKDSETIVTGIRDEWADFIVTKDKQGASVATPPASTGGDTFDKMSLADKMTYANEHPDNAEVKAWLNTNN